MMIPADIRARIEPLSQCFAPAFSFEGRYVNDHCFVEHEGFLHCFYIDGEVGKGYSDPGNECLIGHARTADLRHWEYVGTALQADPLLAHECRSVYAPNIVRKDGVFHMFYSANSMSGAQTICHAVSEDLQHWQRVEGNPCIRPRSPQFDWSEEYACSCRDAHVWHDPDNGRWLLYWVADLYRDDNPLRIGKGEHAMSYKAVRETAVAVSESHDLYHFHELKPALIRRMSVFDAFVMKTESPCMIRNHGAYFLFYRHGNGTKFCVSDDPLEFTFSDSHWLGPCHASEVFFFRGRWYISSCSRPPQDITHTEDRRHGLWLACLDWSDFYPRIAAFER